MDRLIYVAMTGAREAMRAQATANHNLANAGTHGFRAVRDQFMSAPVAGPGLPTRINAVARPAGWDTGVGSMIQTGRDLDVAIQGEGWLAVQDSRGGEAYTRAGNLRVNPAGLLETASGQLVLGNGGPVSIPPYEEIFIGPDGQITVVAQGQGAETAVEVDRLRLVNPPAGELVARGDGLHALKDGGTAPPDPGVRVASGVLESSNVKVAEALVDMIELARRYEMQVRAMNTAEKNDAAAARLLRNDG